MLGMRWLLLTTFLFADVAPTSCGSSRSSGGHLSVSLRDCSCVSGDVTIFVDDAPVLSGVRCPYASPPLSLRAGPHTIRATSGSDALPPRTVSVFKGDTGSVELTCPAR
jgi:hypothetical protein